MRRNQKRRISPFQAGLISLLVITVGVYFGFTKSVPFQHHFNTKSAHEVFAVVAGPKKFVPQASRPVDRPQQQISVAAT